MGKFLGERDHQRPTRLEAAPAPIRGITDVVSMAAGWAHALFLKRDGTVWAVGGNRSGQLGVPEIPGTDSPVMVPGLPKINFIAAGSYHSLAISESGDVWTWGWNRSGQLGIGHTSDSERPTRVPDIKNAKMIAGGLWHSIALDAEGQVWVWGDNQHWQLGFEQDKESLFPKRHLTMEPITSVGADYDRSIALSNTGAVYVWGGEWGKPGVQLNPCNLKVPYRVLPLDKVIDVALGAHAAVASGIYGVVPNGDVVNWRPIGKNYICEGTHPDEEEPVSHVIREGGSVLNLFHK
jgi:alpha-tubulin suppressor-like RCC1 family protein